ncbi:MAG: phospholipase D-like domain-containing protein [Phycisphaerae bacterium]
MDMPALTADTKTPGAVERVVVAGHTLELFTETHLLFEAMLSDIAAATKRVWLETYIFADDMAGQAVAAELQRRARDGLDVRLLYDRLGSQHTDPDLFIKLAAAGVQVHAYHGFWEAFHSVYALMILNRRDHRKLLVIDDRCAYFGGMNIVDHGHLFRAPPAVAPLPPAPTTAWRDLHIRLTGPQQAEVADSLERSWMHAKGMDLSWRPTAYRRVKLRATAESIHFFDSGPGLKFSRAPRVYRRLLHHSTRSVVIAMAYFIPVGRVMREITRARRRNVHVHVLVPTITDVPIAKYARWYLYRKLLHMGIRLYERKNRVMHTKTMVIDRQWTVVGSANMDPRSLYINLEFMAVIRSSAFAQAVIRVCRYEMRHSRRVRFSDCKKRTLWQRFLSTLAYSLRWWL